MGLVYSTPNDSGNRREGEDGRSSTASKPDQPPAITGGPVGGVRGSFPPADPQIYFRPAKLLRATAGG
jgi:hypothetical protein